MDVYQASQIFYAIAITVAALVLTRYSILKSRTLSGDERKAFRPLYAVAVAWAIYAIAQFTIYYEALFPETPLWVDQYYVQQILVMIQIVILAYSASMVLKQYYVLGVSVLIVAVCTYLVYQAASLTITYRVSGAARTMFATSQSMCMILLIVVAYVYAWIAWDSKRGTAIGLAGAVFSQLMMLPFLYIPYQDRTLFPFPLNLVGLFMAFLGPGMAMYVLAKPDLKAKGELFGYGIAFSGPILILSVFAALRSLGFVEALTTPESIFTGFGALAIVLSAGIAAYLYGRWAESRQLATALLMTSFVALSLGQVIGMIAAMGALNLTVGNYIEFLLVAFGITSIASAGLLAAGFRKAGFIPVVLYLVVSGLILQSYPLSIADAVVSFWILIIPLVILALTPVVTFGAAAVRMRRSESPAFGRPLGLSLGILMLLAVRIVFLLLNLPGVDPGYALVSGPYLLMWLAVTGRLTRHGKQAVTPPTPASN